MRLVKITLYSPDGGSISPILYKDKNYVMEDIDAYLNLAYGNISPNFLSEQLDINPLKEIEIKVKLDKEIIEWHQGGTYAKLHFSNNVNYYYFVDEYKSIAPNIVKYKLTMDELNTFYNRLEFTNKTLITREHRDRFIKLGSSGNTYRRNIDHINEGLNPQLVNKSSNPPMLLTNGTDNTGNKTLEDVDFYLLYKTNNDDSKDLASNPVTCTLYASERLLISNNSISTIKVPTNQLFSNSKCYMITANSGVVKGYYGDTLKFTKTLNSSSDPIIIYNVGTFTLGQSNNYNDVYSISDVEITGIEYIDESDGVMVSPEYGTPTNNYDYNCVQFIKGYKGNKISTGVSESQYIESIDSVDRSDPQIVKLIKLPYAPTKIFKSLTGYYTFENDIWEFNGTTLQLKDLSTKFYNTFQLNNYYSLGKYITEDLDLQNKKLPRNIKYESKLYSSEFFNYKIMYDTFIYLLPLEDLDIENVSFNFNPLRVEFKMTTTINSKFYFKFNIPLKNYTDDYQTLVSCSRNNEETLYSNSYLNYLRTGYNYDLKAKEQAIASSWINTGIAIGKTALGALSGNPFTITSGINGLDSIKNSIMTGITQERSIQEKIATLKASSASVVGSDDIDLMSQYCGNRLRVLTTEPRDDIKDMIYNLFYFYGYQTKHFGIPNLNSRYWFNFIQCEAEFKISNIANDILEAIKEKFKNGITIFHYHDNTYDVDQIYENWETDLI